MGDPGADPDRPPAVAGGPGSVDGLVEVAARVGYQCGPLGERPQDVVVGARIIAR